MSPISLLTTPKQIRYLHAARAGLGIDTIAIDTKHHRISVYCGWAMTGQIGPLPDLWKFAGEQRSRLK